MKARDVYIVRRVNGRAIVERLGDEPQAIDTGSMVEVAELLRAALLAVSPARSASLWSALVDSLGLYDPGDGG